VPQGLSEEFIRLKIIDMDKVGRALSFDIGGRHLGAVSSMRQTHT
jgi:hypothetical protein